MTWAEFYQQELIKGERFERYAVMRLKELGVPLERYERRRGQFLYGDTTAGIEIKAQLDFEKYRSLFFEVAAKTNPANRDYVPGGIESPAPWPWMLTGSYQIFFLFSREDLRRERPYHQLKPNKYKTAIGFTIDRARAVDLAKRVWYFPDRLPDGTVTAPVTLEDVHATRRAAFNEEER